MKKRWVILGRTVLVVLAVGALFGLSQLILNPDNLSMSWKPCKRFEDDLSNPFEGTPSPGFLECSSELQSLLPDTTWLGPALAPYDRQAPKALLVKYGLYEVSMARLPLFISGQDSFKSTIDERFKRVEYFMASDGTLDLAPIELRLGQLPIVNSSTSVNVNYPFTNTTKCKTISDEERKRAVIHMLYSLIHNVSKDGNKDPGMPDPDPMRLACIESAPIHPDPGNLTIVGVDSTRHCYDKNMRYIDDIDDPWGCHGYGSFVLTSICIGVGLYVVILLTFVSKDIPLGVVFYMAILSLLLPLVYIASLVYGIFYAISRSMCKPEDQEDESKPKPAPPEEESELLPRSAAERSLYLLAPRLATGLIFIATLWLVQLWSVKRVVHDAAPVWLEVAMAILTYLLPLLLLVSFGTRISDKFGIRRGILWAARKLVCTPDGGRDLWLGSLFAVLTGVCFSAAYVLLILFHLDGGLGISNTEFSLIMFGLGIVFAFLLFLVSEDATFFVLPLVSGFVLSLLCVQFVFIALAFRLDPISAIPSLVFQVTIATYVAHFWREMLHYEPLASRVRILLEGFVVTLFVWYIRLVIPERQGGTTHELDLVVQVAIAAGLGVRLKYLDPLHWCSSPSKDAITMQYWRSSRYFHPWQILVFAMEQEAPIGVIRWLLDKVLNLPKSEEKTPSHEKPSPVSDKLMPVIRERCRLALVILSAKREDVCTMLLDRGFISEYIDWVTKRWSMARLEKLIYLMPKTPKIIADSGPVPFYIVNKVLSHPSCSPDHKKKIFVTLDIFNSDMISPDLLQLVEAYGYTHGTHKPDDTGSDSDSDTDSSDTTGTETSDTSESDMSDDGGSAIVTGDSWRPSRARLDSDELSSSSS